jgi:thiol-disulfide isomerase/thioredoxin
MSAAVASSSTSNDVASSALSRITTFLNTGSNKYILIGFVVFIVLIIVIYYIYKQNLIPEFTKLFNQLQGMPVTANVEDDTGDKHAVLYLFKVDWCPHCKKAVPVFEEVEKAYNDNKNEDKRINGYYVTFKVIDCEADPTTADKYSVSGYPTIKLDKGGEVIEFDAKPDKDRLLEFLHEVL